MSLLKELVHPSLGLCLDETPVRRALRTHLCHRRRLRPALTQPGTRHHEASPRSRSAVCKQRVILLSMARLPRSSSTRMLGRTVPPTRSERAQLVTFDYAAGVELSFVVCRITMNSSSLAREFALESGARAIDACENLEELRSIAKTLLNAWHLQSDMTRLYGAQSLGLSLPG